MDSIVEALENTPLSSKPLFTCEVCGAGYEQKGYLETHLQKHNSTSADGNQKSGECYICGKVMSSKRSLERHVLTHLTCKICKAEFATEDECVEHKKVHTTCDICCTDFVFPSKLTRHIQQKHI